MPNPFYPDPPIDWLNLRGEALQKALRRDVVMISRRGLHATNHSPSAPARPDEIALRVQWLREVVPAAVCLNLVPLATAEWLLENFNPS